jgi:hypothetical protein
MDSERNTCPRPIDAAAWRFATMAEWSPSDRLRHMNEAKQAKEMGAVDWPTGNKIE